MFLTKIWERYFLREMTKMFILFLFGFYALYVLIDYSNHSSSFQHYHFSFKDIVLYYAYEFVARMDLLVPFAILIAFIKTICACNANNELVALLASGIPLKRLLAPFVAFGIFCTFLIYVNTEVLQPLAVKQHSRLEESRAKKKQKKFKHALIQQIPLKDNSSIIFQTYDSDLDRFFDVYWVRSIDDIYRIKYLYPHTSIPTGSIPTGKFTEHLQRNSEGNLIIADTELEKEFPDMVFDKKTLLETVSLPSEMALSTLQQKLPQSGKIQNEKDAQILTSYYYKLAFPWLCLLAVIAPAPFCTRFSRTLPIFFIYASYIFALVAFYIVMDAAVILGERQVISPAIAIWTPFSITFAFFGWKFAKL